MIRKLSDAQVAAFDKTHIDARVRPAWRRCLSERFKTEESFRVVDVGGGNGVLADALLDTFPHSQVTIVDNSQWLLDRNRPHEQKSLTLGSAEDLATLVEDRSVDLICFHWVLHHFVSGGYQTSVDMVRSILESARRKLRPGGRISVFENMYDGLIIDDLPGKLIYNLASSRALAPITSRLGANTAGVGVCFRSQQAWSRLLSLCGFKTLAYDPGPVWPNTLAKRVALHIKSTRKGHFWLADASAKGSLPAPTAA